MTQIVQRAKKVLDFSATVHFIHLIITLIVGVPTQWLWWVVMGISVIVMTLFGEYLCMRQELTEIKRSDFSNSSIQNV